MTVNGLELTKYPRCPLPHTIPIPAFASEGSFYWKEPAASGNDCIYRGCKKLLVKRAGQAVVSDVAAGQAVVVAGQAVVSDGL
jgi:hypothetical protein